MKQIINETSNQSFSTFIQLDLTIVDGQENLEKKNNNIMKFVKGNGLRANVGA